MAVAAAAFVLCVHSGAARAADPVLAAAGDIACQPSSSSTTCQQGSTASLLAAQVPTAIAPLGDAQYPSGALAEFDASGEFNDTWGVLSSGSLHIPFHPVPGNHEYDVSTTAAGYFAYFGTAAGPSSGYYSYGLGGWHVVALNSNCDDSGCANRDSNDGTVSTAELNWLSADLDSHPGQCTLAYWHHPLFSSGDIGGSSGVQQLWTALYGHRADLVLNGHEHHYERFAPQNPTGISTTAGISEIVVGTGGHDIANGFSVPPAGNSAFRDNTHFGALFLTLHAHSYDWAFKATDGTTVDRGSSDCHDQPPLVTTGAATAGQTTVTVAGSVNPNGQATTYHVEYGTDTKYGSSTTTTSAGSGTAAQSVSANLSSLSPATTYHYRVVATNASGTSSGSDQTLTTAAASPPPGAPTQPDAAPPSQPVPVNPTPQPSFRLIARRSMTMLLRRGVLIGLTCPGACSVRAALEGWARVKKSRHHGPLRLGHAQAKLAHAGKTTLVIRLSAAARRELRRLRVEIVLDVAVSGGTPMRLAEPFSLRRAVRSHAASFAPF